MFTQQKNFVINCFMRQLYRILVGFQQLPDDSVSVSGEDPPLTECALAR